MVATTALFGQDSSENVPRLHTQFIAAGRSNVGLHAQGPESHRHAAPGRLRAPSFCTIIMLLIDLSTRQVGGGNPDVY